jgi:hypothetical protein
MDIHRVDAQGKLLLMITSKHSAHASTCRSNRRSVCKHPRELQSDVGVGRALQHEVHQIFHTRLPPIFQHMKGATYN